MITEIRDFSYNNMLTIVLLLPVLFVFLMCMIDLRKTKLFFNVFFSNKFFYTYTLDLRSVFSLYNLFALSFVLQVFSLIIVLLFYEKNEIFNFFLNIYAENLSYVFIYFLTKLFLGKILSYFFSDKDLGKQMLMLETSYLACVGLLVYPILAYGYLHLNVVQKTVNIALLTILFLYGLRLFMLFRNNKNLLSGQLFYIILYLCTLEIFPFIYIFKRYTE